MCISTKLMEVMKMPWGDGTGPYGMGPMTGRGAGYCAGYPIPGFMNPIPGFRGFGWFGRGRGFRFWARVTGLPGWYRASIGLPGFGWRPLWLSQGFPYRTTREEEIRILEEEKRSMEEEIKIIQEELKLIEKRIAELKKKQ